MVIDQPNDKAKVVIICDRIEFAVHRDNINASKAVNFMINASWGVYALREDNRSAQAKVKYFFKSGVFEGALEVSMIVDFNRTVTKEELSLKEEQKKIALLSVDYVVKWIAEASSRMGIFPVEIPSKTFEDLIKSGK